MADSSINKEANEVKKVGCWPSPGCHDKCGILASIEEGRIVKLKGNPAHPVSQGCGDRLPHLMKWQYHHDQLMHPLKRTGNRGENKWERISWNQALDEIADQLKRIKSEYGGESLAVTEGTYRSDMYGIRSRFLNLFGNPGNIGCAGTVCMCNRAALGFALMGAPIANPNFSLASCVVINGWNLTESRRVEWRNIQKPDQNGKKKKLVVIDPRETEAAKAADIWLQLRPGTDTALFLAWINVIIEERLYDETFVKEWTFGFDQLKERVSDYTPDKVSEITWVPAEKIRKAARMYAVNKPAAFNFGMATDAIGLNSMRAEQARVCLRAITGNMSVHGLETVTGPGPMINGKMAVRDAMLQLEDKCPSEQRKKQLGADRFKLMTWTAYEITNKYYKEVYGIPQCMTGHNFLAHQPTVWQAILEGKPYPIKAMLTWTSNPLLNAANVKRVHQALKSPNLDLHVVLEHFMTPTALLADYVLPAASKFEQPLCSTYEDFAPIFMCGERAIQPMGERRTNYEFFRGLAQRLGFGEYFPWETDEELAAYRLRPLGISFKEASTEMYVIKSEPWTYNTINPETGRPTGFATPSGKIELYSNVLKELGYDPLPFYEEPPESPVRTPDIAKDFPFILITGGKFRPQFHSENRQFGMGMREQHPDPLMDINVDTAREIGISEGDWVNIETRRGVIKQRARLTAGIHPRVVNAESHWWFPEQPAEEPSLCGLWQSNVNVLTTDDLDACDPLSGGWPTRALLCKVYKP